MSVAEDFSAYSTTAASNTPLGSDNIGTDLDDHLRDIKRNLKRVGSSFRGATAPESVAGLLWYNTSGTAVDNINVLALRDGSWIPLFDVNNSADVAYARINPISAVPTSRTISAGNALSGGGTLSSDRALSVANASTATITQTAAILNLTIDPFGRVVASSSAATLATAAVMQDRSSTAHYVTPVRMKDHLGVAKFWVHFSGNGTLVASYNVSGVTRNSSGNYTITFAQSVADGNYCAIVQTKFNNGVAFTNGYPTIQSNTDVQVNTIRLDNSTNHDPAYVNVVGFSFA